MNNLWPRPRVVCVACVWTTLGVATAGAWGQCVGNELAKVTASDAAYGDQFGNSVSISPDGIGVALIGVQADDDAGILSGSAYVYRFDPESSQWIQEQKLVAFDGEPFDYFGESVAVSGDRALIGAPSHIHDGHPGVVYFFQYDGTTWIEQQELLASDGFGKGPISISGDLAVIGAPGDSKAGQVSGAAYVFRFDADRGQWIEQAKLTASDAEAEDTLGTSVSISGDLVLIGARGDETDTGSAYVFVKPPGGWTDMTETAKLPASDGAIFDNFGTSVSLSGDVALIGAWRDDDAGSQSGSAYVFRFDPNRSQWIQEQKLAGSDLDEADGFGYALALRDNVALIGARGHDDGGYGAGAAYVFYFDGSTWIEQAKLLASEPAEIDGFGFALALGADGQAVIGAHNDDACPRDPICNSGSACIFGGISDCNNNGELDLCEIADGTAADKNNNGIPDECELDECTWDLDGNGSVGAADLLVLLVSWGPCEGCPADFDGNGSVGASDLLALLVNWGPCP